jgi:5'-deoxynucleotidase YfbR-like HD superfamily hydrolase
MKDEYILTHSGKKFFYLNPKPEQICIEDIAFSLAKQCRYNGHCTGFYSVAEHCFWVSKMISQEYALHGLLHDASEAYICDLPTPLKNLIPGYREIENNIQKVILNKFGLSDVDNPEVHVTDKRMLITEAMELLDPTQVKEWKYYEQYKSFEIDLYYFNHSSAYSVFMKRFRQLYKGNEE